jgi:antirestriction protein ArdC
VTGCQRPSATRVAGFNAWKQLGRQVRKGERGIAILAPLVYRRRLRDAEYDKPEGDEAEGGAADDRIAGFRTAYIFDLSQTEGRPLPTLATVRGQPGMYLQRLRNLVTSRAIRLTYTARIAPAYGVSVRGEIMLLPSLPEADEFSTLVHELAHSAIHVPADAEIPSRAVRETEAEAVAHVVCHAIGLDTNDASSDYVAEGIMWRPRGSQLVCRGFAPSNAT